MGREERGGANSIVQMTGRSISINRSLEKRRNADAIPLLWVLLQWKTTTAATFPNNRNNLQHSTIGILSDREPTGSGFSPVKKEMEGTDNNKKKGRERERCVSFRGGVQWGTRVTEADNAQQTGGDKKRTDRQNKGGSEDGSERDFRLDCTSLFQVRPFVDKLIRVTESALNV